VFKAAARPLFGQGRSVVLAILGVAFETLLAGAGASAGPPGGTTLTPIWRRSTPRLALISVAGGNSEGNPAPVVLSRLVGRDALRTGQPGAITVETDEEQM
jgi:hypothetical protein